MAQAPRTSGEGAADFIRQIVSDPKNVPDVMLLTGYLGASSEEGHDRLYLSPDLTNYVEIPESRDPASGAITGRTGCAWRRHPLGQEGCSAAIQDGARGPSARELFRWRDLSWGARRGPSPAANAGDPRRTGVRSNPAKCVPSCLSGVHGFRTGMSHASGHVLR